jgi:hypothetical protein
VAHVYEPFVRSHPLWGRSLRHAALVVLLRSGVPRSPTAVLRQLEAAGYSVAGENPVKTVADALGYEVRIGRLRRPCRGQYAIGALPKVTAHRVRRRWQEATDH